MSLPRDGPSKAKVLLVDDEPANLLSLKAVLEELDVVLVEAHSGEGALRLLLEGEFAVVFLDVQMPGLDGFETARLIRGREDSRHTPIIFQTAYDTDRTTIEQAYALGAVDFLIKPLIPVVLRAKVNEFVELLQYRQQVKRQAEQLRQTERREFEHKLAEENTRLQQQREWLRVTLGSIGDGVITTDAEGRVTFLNPVAESLTGWKQEQAAGRLFTEVFHIVNEMTRQTVENPIARVIATGHIVGLANHTVLFARDGTERAIDDSAAPIRGSEGAVSGVVLVFRDVTERRRLERAARSLASIVASSDDAIIGKDVNGVITSWNEGAERVFGYPAAEAVGRPVAMLAPSDRADEMPAILARIRRGERVDHFDTVRRGKNGRLVPISLTVSPIRDEDGKIIGASKIARDISERKRAEEALHEEKERLHATLTGIGDAVIVTDAESRVTLMNPVAQALTGWNEHGVGRPLEEVFRIVNEQTRQPVESPVTRVIREGAVVGLGNHTALIARDGSQVPIADSGAPIRSAAGDIIGVVLVFRDVTERKRAEQATRFLADASKSLAALVDYDSTMQKVARLAVPSFADWCAVDVVDPDGSLRRVAVAHANPSKVELAHELHRRYPPDPDAPQGVPRILRTGQPELISEITDALLVETVKDEELRRIMRELGLKSYLGVPLRARGKTVGAITFVAAESGRRFDATDLAVAEDLAHRAGIAMENARLYSEVREADRRKDEFLAMLAHELRNPLAPIRNALQIMKQTGADAAMRGRVREMMERQVQHMTRMVDDLLDVSRITRGKIELRKEVVDLASVVGRTVEATRPLIEDRRQELTVDLPSGPVHLEADPTRLEQVLANVLNNAAKYTDHGGHIWLTARQEGGEFVLRVRDTGVGILADMLPRIFEPFVQSDRVLHQSQGGLGIGLTLVRSLVEMHGGTVTAHSEGPGKGSEFIVRLPALSQQQPIPGAKAAGEGGEPVGAAPQRRILIVDDNVDAAESLAVLLRLEGHDVRVAHDGPAALAAFEADPPDIVFLDIGMPVMNGYDVARRLRQRPGLDNLVLVAMTGWGQEEDRRRSQEAGFDHHLVKPVEPDALRQLLARPR
jgi:PAS domain S-box-containing protein